MDIKSEIAVEFMKTIIDAHLSLVNMACDLRKRPEIKEATSHFYDWTTRSDGNSAICGSLETTLHDGRDYSWILEIISTPSGWAIESEIDTYSQDREHQQIAVTEFPVRRANVFDDLDQSVKEALAMLSHSVKTFDFDQPNYEIPYP